MYKKKSLYRALPETIKNILIVSDGWLAGSSVENIINGNPIVDYDIAVPYDKWQDTIVMLKTEPFILNTFGGFKFNLDGLEIDIWPQDTDGFLKRAKPLTYMYNLKNQILIKNDE